MSAQFFRKRPGKYIDWSTHLPWIAENAADKTSKEIAEHLGLPVRLVRQYLTAHRVIYKKVTKKTPKTRKGWTQEDLDWIHENAGKTPIEDVAAKLGRTVRSLRSKFSGKGVRFGMLHRPWTLPELTRLLHEVESKGLKDVVVPGRTSHAIIVRAHKQNIRPYLGFYSLARIMLETGYDRYQIFRAKDSLRQTWTKLDWGTNGRYRIGLEQFEDIVEFLASEGRQKTG